MNEDQPEEGEKSLVEKEADRIRRKRLAVPEAASRSRFMAVGLFIAALIWFIWPAPHPAPPPPAPVSVAVPQQPAVPVVPAAPPRQYEEAIGPQLPPVPPVVKRRYTGHAVIALVIDDCGISVSQTGPVLDILPPAATLSFLPYGHATVKMAARARAAGHDVMLHMPMQPVGRDDPGPDAVLVGLPGEEIQRRVTAALAAVPDAVGVNNHMGSAATADAATIQPVIEALADKSVFFLDSYTNSRSLAYQTALAAGMPAARRDIFLDDTITPEAIDAQLQRLEVLAHKQGSAIAIGHPHPATLAALQKWLPSLSEKGLDLVRVKDLTNRSAR